VLQGRLEDAVPDQQAQLDWRRSSFAEMALSMGQPANLQRQTLAIRRQAGPELLSVSSTDNDDEDAGLVAFANPFGAARPLVRSAVAEVFATYVLASGASTFESLRLESHVALADADTAIEPLVGPPLDLRLDGTSADDRITVDVEPTLSWAMPAIGVPDRFEIAVTLLSEAGGEPIPLHERLLIVPGDVDSIELRGLWSGEYAVKVAAVVCGGCTASAPLRAGLPYGRATAVTNVFRVE
jgi:hypothetical protein